MSLPWGIVEYPNRTVQRCEVTIIGATLPSLWLALKLVSEGLSVSILEHRPFIAEAQELRQLGVVQLGLLDNFWRLSQGVGESSAHEIYLASRRGAEIIRSLSEIHACGWMLAKDKREERELQELMSLFRKWNVDASLISPKKLTDLFSSETIRMGIQIQEEGCIQPKKLTSTLCQKLLHHSTPICCSVNIQHIEDHNGGVRIYHQHGFTESDIVIYMQHDQLQKLDPFFSTTMNTIRTQSIAYRRKSPRIPHFCTTQYGYIHWRDEGELRLLSGCRWATPHLEQGETDDSIIVPEIEKALIRTAKQCFLEKEIQIKHRWSMIERKSCDGLPLVGAVPGRDHVVACTAFQGRLLGLGFAAAESISELVLNGTTSALPSNFSTRRFIV